MRSAMFAVVAMTSVGACSVALDFDSREPKGNADASASSSSGSSGASSGTSGTTSSSGSSTTDADAPDGSSTDGPSGSCPSSGGPTPVNAGSFCIDSTEVTKGQYAAFLATTPSTAGQPAACANNTSFAPAAAGPGGTSDPVVEIDWCDAVAFCTWAKKKLCNEQQWSTACNGTFAGVTAIKDGVEEWVDNCTGDNCPARGGTGCGATANEPRLSPHEDVGFRCCSP